MNNLKYKDLQDRILTNINEKSNQDILTTINNDIKDVLMTEIYGKSEAPRKVVEFNLAQSAEVTVGLASAIVDGFTLTAGVLITPETGDSTLTIKDLSEINTFSFLTANEILHIGNPYTGTIKILSEDGNSILWSDTFEIVADGTQWREVSLTPAISGVNIQVIIEVPEGQAQLKDFKYTKSWNVLELPNDFYIPLEVKFSATGNKKYFSQECTAEEFLLWNPSSGAETADISQVVTSEDSVGTENYSIQNLKFDGTIAYYFEYIENKVYIHWKKAIDGILSIYYSYAPSIIIAEGKTINLHRMFADLIVDGCTIKMLRRIQMKTKEQFIYLSIRDNISYFQKHFDVLLANYTGYVNRKAETPIIDAFTFVNDSSMELSE